MVCLQQTLRRREHNSDSIYITAIKGGDMSLCCLTE